MTTTTVDGFSTSFTAVVGDFRRFLENESRNGTSSLDDETTVFNESMSDLCVLKSTEGHLVREALSSSLFFNFMM